MPGPPYEPVIGLEVHAQLRTATKIFCGCPTTFGSPPNTNVCPVCLGFPGTLPVLNRAAVEFAVKAALATGCAINHRSVFARKNYFYPDLPKGYQISMYELPIAERGRVPIETGENGDSTRAIRLHRIHLEEDAGKLIHEGTAADAGETYVDYNRAGVPLIEIVSEPDITSPEEAHAYLTRLKSILTYLEICDGNMEEGSLRCDANVSVRKAGDETLGTRVEIKNLNSFRNVARALDHEIARQSSLLEAGDTVTQETRLFDADRGITLTMRGKEEAMDYRYFPEPDIPPLALDDAWIDALRGGLPELPDARRRRLMSDLGLGAAEAMFLSQEKPLADYYEATAQSAGNPRAAAAWVANELMGRLNAAGRTIAESPVRPDHLGGLIRRIEDATISGKIAKTVFEEMFTTGEDPEAIIRARGLTQITDESAIGAIVDSVIAAHPAQADQYRAGKSATLGWFVGQVMKETQGKANPALVNKLLKEKLGPPS